MATIGTPEQQRRPKPVTAPPPAGPAVSPGNPPVGSQPHVQALRGNGQLEEGDVRRGQDQLARVLGW